MNKIYLAHPISGLSADEVFAYYDTWIKELIHTGAEVLHPMTGKEFLRTELKFKAHDYRQPISTNKAIVGRDSWMIQQADIVLIDLTGAQHVSIGCVSELAWAFILGKHTIVIMKEDNIHQHAFVLHQANIVFTTMREAVEYLWKMGSGEY